MSNTVIDINAINDVPSHVGLRAGSRGIVGAMNGPEFLFHIAFTGHRRITFEDEWLIEVGLEVLDDFAWTIEQMHGLVVYHTGGAPGFDTKVLEKLGYGLHTVSTVHVPFQYQLNTLVKHFKVSEDVFRGNFVSVCSQCWKGKYTHPGDLQRRNEHMVDSSRLLVSYYNHTSGGTKNCIDYANKKNVPVVDVREITSAHQSRWIEEARRERQVL